MLFYLLTMKVLKIINTCFSLQFFKSIIPFLAVSVKNKLVRALKNVILWTDILKTAQFLWKHIAPTRENFPTIDSPWWWVAPTFSLPDNIVWSHTLKGAAHFIDDKPPLHNRKRKKSNIHALPGFEAAHTVFGDANDTNLSSWVRFECYCIED